MEREILEELVRIARATCDLLDERKVECTDEDCNKWIEGIEKAVKNTQSGKLIRTCTAIAKSLNELKNSPKITIGAKNIKILRHTVDDCIKNFPNHKVTLPICEARTNTDFLHFNILKIMRDVK